MYVHPASNSVVKDHLIVLTMIDLRAISVVVIEIHQCAFLLQQRGGLQQGRKVKTKDPRRIGTRTWGSTPCKDYAGTKKD